MSIRAIVGALVMSFAALSASALAQSHTRDFWRGVVDSGFAVPAGNSAPALADELSQMLGDPDPEVRDAFAGTICRNGSRGARSMRRRCGR